MLKYMIKYPTGPKAARVFSNAALGFQDAPSRGAFKKRTVATPRRGLGQTRGAHRHQRPRLPDPPRPQRGSPPLPHHQHSSLFGQFSLKAKDRSITESGPGWRRARKPRRAGGPRAVVGEGADGSGRHAPPARRSPRTSPTRSSARGGRGAFARQWPQRGPPSAPGARPVGALFTSGSVRTSSSLSCSASVQGAERVGGSH